MDETCYEKAVEVSNELRKINIICQTYFEDTKFKNKLSYADKLNFKYAIIIGEDEVKNNVYTLKDLQEHTQETLSLLDLINALK